MLANNKLVIQFCNYLFTKAILFGINLTICIVQEKLKKVLLVSLIDKQLTNKEKLVKVKLNCYLNIIV